METEFLKMLEICKVEYKMPTEKEHRLEVLKQVEDTCTLALHDLEYACFKRVKLSLEAMQQLMRYEIQREG